MFYRDRIHGVPFDSVAQISSDTLVGDKFVDISGGRSSRDLPAEGEMTYKDQPELVRSLDLTQFTQQLRLVDATLTDIEQGRSQFGKFVQGQDFYNDLMRRMTDLQEGIRAAVSTTGMVGSLISSDRMHAQTTELLEQLDRTIAQIQAGPMLRSTVAIRSALEYRPGVPPGAGCVRGEMSC